MALDAQAKTNSTNCIQNYERLPLFRWICSGVLSVF